MKTLTTDEVRRRVEAGPFGLFDVRGDVEFEQGHLPGAKSAPLGSLNFRIVDVMNPESEVVIYANGGDDDRAIQAVERLEKLRMTNVYLYTEGLEGWKQAGIEVVLSPRPKDHTWGEVLEVRPLIVNREEAYGGAFKHKPGEDTGGAGG